MIRYSMTLKDGWDGTTTHQPLDVDTSGSVVEFIIPGVNNDAKALLDLDEVSTLIGQLVAWRQRQAEPTIR